MKLKLRDHMAKDMNKGCILPGDKQKKVTDNFYFIVVK